MPPTKKPHRIAPAGLIFVRPSGWRGLFSLAAFRALFDHHLVGGEVLALHLAERVVADRGFGALRQFGRMLFGRGFGCDQLRRSEEHTSELQSLMRLSYAVFCLTKKTEAKT